jgi:thioredoxin reductase (NADPH)
MVTKEKVIIIGSGPAGLTAAIYCSRSNLLPLVIEGFQSGGISGGQLMTTGIVENFPGFPHGIGGQELMAMMRTQAEGFGARFIMDDVEAIELHNRPFLLTAASGETYSSESVIIATGAVAKRLPMDSEKKFFGHGVSACAVCDGALPIFRNNVLAVLGGGDSAIEEAQHLTKFGSKVYMIHRRDEFRASKIMQKRAFENPKIEILWNKTVEDFYGGTLLEGITLKDAKTGAISTIAVSGVFEAIGHTPNTAFLNNQIELDKSGYIVTQPGSAKTSREGIFSGGDVTDSKYRQAITAAAGGCRAAIDCERWLVEMG